MKQIIFFVPYTEMGELVQRTFAEQNDGHWQIQVILLTGVRPLVGKDLLGDVAIARGVTYQALQQQQPHMPVVELPISGYDIMRALLICKRRYAAQRVAIVGSRDMIYGAESAREIMDMDVITAAVEREDDAEACLRRLKDSGVTAVIGGVMSTEIATQLGLTAVFIESGREAIYQALQEAKRVVGVRRREKERAELFRNILDYANEGIVAVDDRGKIRLVNRAAAAITGVVSPAAGQGAAAVLPQLELQRVVASGQARLGSIKNINGQDVTVNSVPIKVKDAIVGAVATFQPIMAIRELEGNIRRKMYRRGHVAKFTFADMAGESPAIKRVITLARRCSESNANVLIIGETGTGKEVLAQSIHNASSRRQEPFVAVNCAALPENLLESELFGYVEGAFTGARKGGKMGLFEAAHRGTIFLDEISEISPRMQGRLLRVLQEREISRVGDDAVIPVDVRVIAATNRNLPAMMRKGTFRPDLYYRLDILRLSLPPLRQRREDIIPLLQQFLRADFCRQGRVWGGLTAAAQARLLAYDWPGNVRELRNVAERLAVLTSGDVIDVAQVAAVLSDQPVAPAESDAAAVASPEGQARDVAALLQALEETHYHYGRAAALLGISRTTLWRRLRAWKRANAQS